MAFANKIGSLLKQNVKSTPSIYQAVRCMPSSKLFTKGVINSTDNLRHSFNDFGEVVDARIIVNQETGKSRYFSSFDYEEDTITFMTTMDQKGSLFFSPRCVSAMREIRSKLLGNGINGFNMGTDSCVAAMEAKKEHGQQKDSLFEKDYKSRDGSITLGREYSDELGNESLSPMRPQKSSEVYYHGLSFLKSNTRRNSHVRFYSSGGRNTNFGPKRTKFAKQFKGRMKGKSSSGTHISFGRYALQALEPAWVTARQIEAGRRAMSRLARSGGKIWVRVFPDKPITGKPAETRMGRGKGAVEYWTSVVKPGRILYEMDGVSEAVARSAILLAAFKMPIKTRFIKI